MADCHDLFQDFYKKITIDKSKRDSLMSARDAVKRKITNYFKNELEQKVPDYIIQGSYAMDTLVNPLDGEYDIDVGVHLQNFDSDMKKWSKPQTVHNWVIKAVEDHTKDKPIDKRTCVRVVYSGHYHLDLPIYIPLNDKPYLAEKGEADWHYSDPRAFVEWFKVKVKDKGDQVRRLVKYLKAWVDYQSKSTNLLSGFVLTILVVEGYKEAGRDDSSLAGTVKNIFSRLEKSESIFNPVDKEEDLRKRITDAQMKNFKEKLSGLLENAKIALKEETKKESCKKWRKEFGDRFSNCEDVKELEKPRKTTAPAILRDDGRSAY